MRRKLLTPAARARICASVKATCVVFAILCGLTALAALLAGIIAVVRMLTPEGARFPLWMLGSLLCIATAAIPCLLFVAAYQDVSSSCRIAVDQNMPWYYWLSSEMRAQVRTLREQEEQGPERDYVGEYIAEDRLRAAVEQALRDFEAWKPR